MKVLIYALSFIEGMLVMSFELISTRLLAPYFGTSLYVITSVLGVTMLSLLIGYYLGGNLVKRNSKNIEYIFLGIAACYLILLPIFAPTLLTTCLQFGLLTGVMLASILTISIPLILLGAVSPIFVQQLAEINEKAGTASGNIYAISTLGGVLSTFVIGLWFVPVWGIQKTAFITGLLASMVPIYMFLSKEIRGKFAILFLLISCCIVNLSFTPASQYNLVGVKKLYSSQGILGQLEVFEELNDKTRLLLNNGMLQTKANKENWISLMPYNHIISTVASYLPVDSRQNAALIGLAGGTLVDELKRLGYQNITVVDIDNRTNEVAKNYFGIQQDDYTFINDDGRHFIRTTKNSFDVIIVDVSLSEQQP
ncbi:MAG: fused MFS/spermidine synthase, partial [Saprospiraceae bacterium]